MYSTTAKNQRLEETIYVEEPFIKQLENMQGGLWKVLRLEFDQVESDSYRESFTEVVIKPELVKSLKKINPELSEDQLHEAITRITNLPNETLLENNKFVLQLLIEGDSVQGNEESNNQRVPVKYLDFDNVENNSFLAISQFKVRVLGTEHNIYPDITLFVNGMPIVLVECKSPKAKDPIPEAIDQMMRYSEQRNYVKEGNKQLFAYNQFLIATCRTTAKFGTITTEIEKLFFKWTDPYPFNLNDLEHEDTSPNDQTRLVQGMLYPENLLDIIRSFTIFSQDSKGKIIKVVSRYQQFRAVKLSINRLLHGQNRRERGGIIWHTQGSGKSFTMVFLIREMYHYPELQSFKILLLTDRDQLDKQLRETAASAGYSVNDPENIRKLQKALKTNTSEIVSCMIHKFQERDLREIFPELNTSEKILVLTDEAHRSQYSLLGANLDKALPNATRIAFTGTPIEKTERTFGEYIDKYTMAQAIEDGVILKIVYEGRTNNAEISDTKGMDAKFVDVFSEYNINERLQIIRFESKQAYLESEATINAKAKDMLKHYVQHVFPNGFKAQVVSCSKEAAHRYKMSFDRWLKVIIRCLKISNPNKIDITKLEKLKTAVIMSSGHNDKPDFKDYGDTSKHDNIIKSFKLSFEKEDEGITGDIGIIIVVEMLLTGFDAPIEQVMYLDRIVVAHNLLQAIARVNRVDNEFKDKGFVVDYIGIGHHLKAALDSYAEKERQEIIDCFEDEQELFDDLTKANQSVKDILEKNGMTDYLDNDAIFDLFYDEDIRFEFINSYRHLSTCLDLVLPRKEALDFMKDYFRFSEINVLAGQHLRDSRMSMKGISTKLRTITDEYLISRGITQKVEPISIMDDKFLENVKLRKRTKTKAAEVEHAIRNFIDINIEEDPELYATFSEILSQILQEFKDNWDMIYKKLEELRQRIINAQSEPTYGLHRKKQMPFFRIFKKEFYNDKELSEDEISLVVELTKEIFEKLALELKLTGFWTNQPAQNRLRGELLQILLFEDYKVIPNLFTIRNQVITRILELAKTNNDTILYAE